MKSKIAFILFLCVLSSCSTDKASEASEQGFQADTILVPVQFMPFEDSRIPEILAEANLCKDIPKDSLQDTINMFDPPCMANFYRMFQFNFSNDITEQFGVTIAANVHKFPIRRTILMVKEGNKWVMMNRFGGDLVEMRTTESGYNDLIIRHPDVEAGSFAIKYVYKDGKYQPDVAEEVNDKLIKKSLVDSLSPIIIKRVQDNQLFQ